MRKICILGKCSNSRIDAPIYNRDWEIWTLGWDPVPVTHRTFEMHANWRNFRGNDDDASAHRTWLIGQNVPVYMLEKEDEIPNSVRYPIEDVTRLAGLANATGRTAQPYIESSISYMMALAMLEMKDDPRNSRIGIWGVDMNVSTEYVYQKANLEYLIGMARGTGIKVFVPPQSALLTSAAKVQYGYWTATEAGTPKTPEYRD